MNLVIISYEFTFSPFSGNGVLARSLVKALLLHASSRITVWCCRPAPSHGTATSADLHLEPPEISEDQYNRLELMAVQLEESQGWRKLDEGSAWQEFAYENLSSRDQQGLAAALADADAAVVIDWTGACAWRSLAHLFACNKEGTSPAGVAAASEAATTRRDTTPPMVYLNFRVYSSGVKDKAKHEQYDDWERQALDAAKVVISLSQKDKVSLQSIMSEPKKDVHILVPPLRGDVQTLANLSADELRADLPPEAVAALDNHTKPRIFITCVARLGREKEVMRFVRFVEKAQELWQTGFIPLLAGAASDVDYANQVKQQLREAQPNAVIIDHFLSPRALAAVFARSALNFHPCGYEAFGMTIVEAAAFGCPSVVAADGHVGASAIVGNGASIEVDMTMAEDLSLTAVQQIQQVMDDAERVRSIGALAREKALAWDEPAYGKALLEHVPR